MKTMAEDCNYWKTGRSSPDTWMDKAIKLIVDFGGELISSGYILNREKSAFMIEFSFKNEKFKIIWPVLRSERNEELPAKRQAATMLYHSVKAKLIEAQVLGMRHSFFAWLVLPNGRPMSDFSNDELADQVPAMLTDRVDK